jgi:hypothetical protein
MGEAPEPHGVFLRSATNINKVFDIIHMLWMGSSMYHHANTSNLLVQSWKGGQNILEHSSVTNDKAVPWLRLQIHMEFLDTYTS